MSTLRQTVKMTKFKTQFGVQDKSYQVFFFPAVCYSCPKWQTWRLPQAQGLPAWLSGGADPKYLTAVLLSPGFQPQGVETSAWVNG